MLQKVKEVGGEYLCGVNYCAMDKYPGPASAAGLKNCTDSLKVCRIPICFTFAGNMLSTAYSIVDAASHAHAILHDHEGSVRISWLHACASRSL